MQTTIEKNRQREYERYEAFKRFEYERRLTDEVTDMSERLAAPMRNTFEYEMRDDGELWFQGEPIRQVFDTGVRVAEELALRNPQFTTELIRRHLERQEYDEMRKLALGSDDDPDTLVVMSPIPDAVLQGIELNAYDRDRAKTLVRIFRRTSTGIEATSLSLDRSDRDGLNAIAERFGQSIDPWAGSEDILAMRLWGYAASPDENTARVVRGAYDTALSKKHGGEWYAGRQASKVLDAKAFIEEQPDLVALHMKEIDSLKKKYVGKQLEARLEDARYNLAAALTRRMRGDGDSQSLAEAGEVARANGETYRGDCPTDVKATVEQGLAMLGFHTREWKYGSCRVCLESGMVGECDVCMGCEEADNYGADLGEIYKRALRRRARQMEEQQQATDESLAKMRTVRQVFGDYAEERTVQSVGSADTVVFDRRTGTAFAKRTRSGYASL